MKTDRPKKTNIFDPSADWGYGADYAPEREFIPRPSEKTLDIGCGGGDLACFLAPETKMMIGLDISLGLLLEVKKKHGKKTSTIFT